MKFLANKTKVNNREFMLIVMLFLSTLVCGKSISLNLTNVPSFSLGEVSVQAESISESLGSTSVSAEAIPEVEVAPKKEVAKVELVKSANVSSTKPKSVAPAGTSNLSLLTIPSINLSTNVDFASVTNLPVLEKKLLYNPLVESTLSSDFCGIGLATYVYGHSEPAVNGTENYPATRVFKNLDQLVVGQQIQASNTKGQSCSYKINEIFVVVTDNKDQVTNEDYAKLFYPALLEDKSILTLQTCVKGSATHRLIIRAISV